MMKNIIFVGPPGSGKGTQSLLLSKKLNIPVISTGEELRKEVENKTKIGIEVSDIISQGSLVPDEIVLDIIKNRLKKSDCLNGFILDGFPRNIDQAKKLEEAVKNSYSQINYVFDFVVSDDEVLIKRISGRFTCSNCGEIYNKFFKNTKIEGACDKCGGKKFEVRKDDKYEIIQKRLEIYKQVTSEIIDFYRKKNLLNSIDVFESESSIFSKILEKINLKNL